MIGAFHICSHTSDLDDLSRRDRKDPEKVLDVLRGINRFSVFDIDAPLGHTLNLLKRRGAIAFNTADHAYPWTGVRVLEPAS